MECRILNTIPTNPTVVPYHLQTLQLFPTAYKPYSCSHAPANLDYSARVRVETHSACLRVRGVHNARYNTHKPYSCSLQLTNPKVVPTQTGKQRSSCDLQTLHAAENPRCSYYLQYLQTLQLFPTTYKPYSCSHSAENHDYSVQVRVETHSFRLRMRG